MECWLDPCVPPHGHTSLNTALLQSADSELSLSLECIKRIVLNGLHGWSVREHVCHSLNRSPTPTIHNGSRDVLSLE